MRIESGSVIFPLTRLGATLTKTVTIRNTGWRDQTLTNAAITEIVPGGSPDTFRVLGGFPVTLRPNATTTLNVEFKSPGRGVFVAILHVGASHERQSDWGTVVGLGQDSSAAESGDFAIDRSNFALRCGTSEPNYYGANYYGGDYYYPGNAWLSNLGLESLTVERIELSGPDAAEFQVAGTFPLFLSPGDAEFVQFTYRPRSSGSHSASAKIHTRSGNVAKEESVSLAGDANLHCSYLAP